MLTSRPWSSFRTEVREHGVQTKRWEAAGRVLLGRNTSRREKRSVAMKHSEMATALRQAAADMQLIAITDGDWEMPDEMVLTYISNFLTDPSLRRPRAVKPSG